MKRKIGVIALMFVLISTSCGQKNQAVDSIDNIKLKENQRILTGSVKEIYGNEVVIAEAEESSDLNFGGDRTIENKEASETGGDQNGMDPSENATSKARRFQGSPNSSDTPATDSNPNANKRVRNRTAYSLTGREENLTIPVGTNVTTLLGTKTTFSRLAVNDVLKMVLETDANGEEVVVAIWIVG